MKCKSINIFKKILHLLEDRQNSLLFYIFPLLDHSWHLSLSQSPFYSSTIVCLKKYQRPPSFLHMIFHISLSRWVTLFLLVCFGRDSWSMNRITLSFERNFSFEGICVLFCTKKITNVRYTLEASLKLIW